MKKNKPLVKARVKLPEAIEEEIDNIPVDPVPVDPKQTDVFTAKVLAQAKNPQWVYCVAVGRDLGRMHVVIPRRMANRLVGKIIEVEAITDHTGTSYRYVVGQSH